MSSEDQFPARPVPAVGAIVFRGAEVLLVKRGKEPEAGRWSLPGGLVEIGETVESAAVRECREETGVQVLPRRVFEVADFIRRKGGRIRWHYVLIDLLCDYVDGEPFPQTDAVNARFISLAELGEYDVTEGAYEVVRRAAPAREVIEGS